MLRHFLLVLILSFGWVPGIWPGSAGAADVVDVADAAVEPVKPESVASAGKEPAAGTENFKLRHEGVRGDGTSIGSASLQMMAGLMAVLAVIAGLAWLVRRLHPVANGSGSGLRVSHALSLGQKEKLLVVEIENHRLLIGVTPQQISLLQVLGDAPPPAKPDNSFAQQMQALLTAGAKHEK